MNLSRLARHKSMVSGKHLVLCLGILTVSVLAAQPTTFASTVEDDPYTRSTLQGLDGVYVAVEPLSPDIESRELSAAMLKRDAELQLRIAGIRVLSKREWATTKGGPVCYVEVNVITDVVLSQDLGFALYAYEIKVEFNQDVVLVRDMTRKALSPTWSISYFGMTNSLPRIRGKAKELVARFVAAYLEVNPKESEDESLGFPGQD